jgi:hypothetical protein
MKINLKAPLVLTALLTASVTLASCQQPENNMSEPTFDASSEVASASYLIGFRQAESIAAQGGDIIDMQAYALGAKDAIAGVESQVPVEQEEMLMSVLSDALVQQKAASGEAYMAENAARPEVTTTESGLQYEVLVEGSGPKPSATDTGGYALSRHPAGRHDIRQFGRPWQPGFISGESRHRRLDRSTANDGCRFQVAFGNSA